MTMAIHARRWAKQSLLMCIALIPTITFSATDTATLQVGRIRLGPCFSINGYHALLLVGSYSPIGLTGGQRVLSFFDVAVCGVPNANSVLNIQGFPSNPGAGWLQSVTCNGVTRPGSAATFMYNTTASWSWPQGFNLGSLPVGTAVSCTIVHN